MPEVKNIKDKTPNQELVKHLEGILEEVKAGDIRSMVYVMGYDDDCLSHGWHLDERNTPRRILAEMVLMQHDFVVNIEMKEGDSVLAKNFNGSD